LNPTNNWHYYSKTNKYYQVFSGITVDYNEAEFICQTYFGEYSSNSSSLVTIKSWDEQKFVYSLALMSMRDKIQGESFWIGAVEVEDRVNWIETITTHDDDKKNYDNLFDEQDCFACKYRSGKCGSLDLIRGSGQYMSVTNKWKFSECDYKSGFICQIITKK